MAQLILDKFLDRKPEGPENSHTHTSKQDSSTYKILSEFWGQTRDNIINPAINAGLIQPLNSIANVVDVPSGKNLIPKIEQLKVSTTQNVAQLSIQSIAAGIGSLLPYSVAGIGMSKFVKNQSVARIAGCGLYDGIRDTNPGETRLGNIIGGIAAFSIFESSSTISRSFHIPLQPTRLMTGFGGAISQQTLSKYISSGELPSSKEYLTNGITYGTISLLLPIAQSRLQTLIPKTPITPVENNVHSSTLTPEASKAPIKNTQPQFMINQDLPGFEPPVSLDSIELKNLSRKLSGYSNLIPEHVFSLHPEIMEEMRAHNIKGHDTKLWLSGKTSQDFAKLHAYKFLKEHAEDIDLNKYSSEKQPKIVNQIEHSQNLKDHHLYNRTTPQQIAAQIDAFPNSSIISDIVCFNELKHPDHANNPKSKVLGEYFNKVILLYQSQSTKTFPQIIHHEYWHAVAANNPLSLETYKLAYKFDPQLEASSYAKTSIEESYATLGGEVLSKASLDDFTKAALNIPTRMCVVGKELAHLLQNPTCSPEEFANYKVRIHFLKTYILPVVLSNLREAVKVPAKQEVAQKLLNELSEFPEI